MWTVWIRCKTSFECWSIQNRWYFSGVDSTVSKLKLELFSSFNVKLNYRIASSGGNLDYFYHYKPIKIIMVMAMERWWLKFYRKKSPKRDAMFTLLLVTRMRQPNTYMRNSDLNNWNRENFGSMWNTIEVIQMSEKIYESSDIWRRGKPKFWINFVELTLDVNYSTLSDVFYCKITPNSKCILLV